MLECLECGGAIAPNTDVRVSEIIECPECRVELEVLTLSPITIGLAPEVEEDWGE